MSFRLSGDLKDKELFKSIVEVGVKNGGRLFYREDANGNIVELVYFSGAKRVNYTGEIDQQFAGIVRAEGARVKLLIFNESEGILKIVQE
jgi:hypothetical protein